MLTAALSILMFLIFATLSGIHFYWVFGGDWGLKQAVPTKEPGAPVPVVPWYLTLVVALGLLGMGVFYLRLGSIVSIELPLWIWSYGKWCIPALFTIRAIGEFNYVGFFKKFKDSDFAKADTRIFAPLCLGMGVIGFVIAVLS